MASSPATPTHSSKSRNSRTRMMRQYIPLPSFVIHGHWNSTRVHGEMTTQPGPRSGKSKSASPKRMTAYSGCHSKPTCKSSTTWPSPSTNPTSTRSSSCMQVRDNTDSRSTTQSTNTSTSRPRRTHTVTSHAESATLITMSSSTSRTEATIQLISSSMNGYPTKASALWANGPRSFQRVSTRSQL